MHIKQVDPAGRAEDLAAVLPVIRAAHAGFVPGEPVPCGQRVRQWTAAQHQRTSVSFAAFDDADESVAVGVTMGGHSEHNPDLHGTWSFIAPGAEGPEIAAALMERLSEYCLDHGIGRLMVNTAAAADTVRYAPQRGTTPSFVGVRSGLDLAGVGSDGSPDFTEFSRNAAPSSANARYTLVHWLDACPGDLAEAYAAAGDAMNDAPPEAPDLVDPVRDVARLRAAEAAWMRQGVRVQVTAAVAPDGAVGGFTMVALYPEQPEFAEVWDTGVARGHRGHGLGVRLKAAATLRLVADYPAVRGLYTFTARDNERMIAVNRRLGYRDLATWEMYVHEVGG